MSYLCMPDAELVWNQGSQLHCNFGLSCLIEKSGKYGQSKGARSSAQPDNDSHIGSDFLNFDSLKLVPGWYELKGCCDLSDLEVGYYVLPSVELWVDMYFPFQTGSYSSCRLKNSTEEFDHSCHTCFLPKLQKDYAAQEAEFGVVASRLDFSLSELMIDPLFE